MLNLEIAEALKNVNILAMAEKAHIAPAAYTDDENLVIAQLDPIFKTIGEKGADPERVIASFINRTIEEEVYNAPDELLDRLFTRGSVGEFDAVKGHVTPKNTIKAYEAAKGGSVERSWLDVSVLNPITKNLQVDTDITYADLRRAGWKTVANITTNIHAAFQNKMYAMLFDAIDAGIASGASNYITESTTAPTAATANAIALYLNERGTDGIIVGLTKYIQAISKLAGFVSEDMKNEVHRKGLLGSYDGCALMPISSANTLGDGSLQIKNNRLYGIAKKIGYLDMKGAVRTYETYDNIDEKIAIKVTGFEFSYMFNADTLKNVVKVVIA